MKHIYFFVFGIFFGGLLLSQQISTINSGAVSSNAMIYSVGEIFVNQEDIDDSSSGLIGVVSVIEFHELGMDEIESESQMYFYPNPTKNSIYFDTNAIKFSEFNIFDLAGKLLYSGKISNNKINLNHLNPGIYFLKTDNEEIRTIKIIKK